MLTYNNQTGALPELPDWSNKKVLVVEDVENNYELIEAILKKTKIKIVWARTGNQAMLVFSEQTDIDIILMDIKLPDINGLDLTRQIKEKNKEIPIIAQTAYALTGDREKTITAGCDAYLSKPLPKAKLLKVMSDFIGK